LLVEAATNSAVFWSWGFEYSIQIDGFLLYFITQGYFQLFSLLLGADDSPLYGELISILLVLTRFSILCFSIVGIMKIYALLGSYS